MKRFINLADQIIEGEFKFAWFDTVTASFETHAGAQTWRTWAEFETDYEGEDLARYSALFPDYLPHPCPRCGRHRVQSDGVCEKCLWDTEGNDFACVLRPRQYNSQGPIFTDPDENLILGAE